MPLSKIQAESMNLADTYAFTGTVSGAGEANDYKLITTTEATNASTIVFDNTVVTSDYDDYYISMGSVLVSNNGTDVHLRLSSDNGSSTFSTVKTGKVYRNLYGGSSFGHEQGSYGYTFLSGALSDGTTGWCCSIWLYDVNSSRYKFVQFLNTGKHTGGEGYSWFGGSEFQDTGAINYMRIQPGGGTISGKFSLYGIKR